MASSAPHDAKSPEDHRAWLQRVHEVQSARLTPEARQAMQARAEQSRKLECQRVKCKAMTAGASRGNALFREGLRQMSSAVSPADYADVSSRYMAANKASCERQERTMQRMDESLAVCAAEVREADDESAEEEEGLQEAGAIMHSPDVAAMVMDSANAQAEPMAALPGHGGARAAESELEALLGQLRAEPDEASECAAKFKIYEGYSELVQQSREQLLTFHAQSKPDVPPAVAAGMDQQIKNIDSHEAMGVPDDAQKWFVYYMVRQAEKNNRAIAGVLTGFERKLEMLAKSDQTNCPVCLEDFQEGDGPRGIETLSCCHKLCKECWASWKEVTRGRPFCPLCRNAEFLDVLAREVSAA